jgi:small conductance mechanosensitive channel
MSASASPALGSAANIVSPPLSPSLFAWTKVIDVLGALAINLATAALILVATLWLARWGARLAAAAMARLHPRRGAPDPTLQSFASSAVRYTVLVVGFVATLQQLGVRATSIIAVLGAASLAVGLALQGALTNVAAGVMILLFRPYRVGDIIESGGRVGRVETLDLFVTELATLDNLKVVIPNGKVFGDVIVNHSTHDRRRADVTVRLPVNVDVSRLIDRLRHGLAADPRVLAEPPPLVELTSLTETAVELTVRPWVRREDYGAVKADILLWTRRLQLDPDAPLANAMDASVLPG